MKVPGGREISSSLAAAERVSPYLDEVYELPLYSQADLVGDAAS